MKNPKLRKLISVLLILIVVFWLIKKDNETGGAVSSLIYSLLQPEQGQSVEEDPGSDPPVLIPADPSGTDPAGPSSVPLLDEHGTYDSKEDVALFLHLYGRLPDNYVTKEQAEAAGWSGGSVEKVLPGKCIGGTYFGNYENLVVAKEGRVYHECDIDTLGRSSRGSKRLVYSNDGVIYYTKDHYKHFELLYGDP